MIGSVVTLSVWLRRSTLQIAELVVDLTKLGQQEAQVRQVGKGAFQDRNDLLSCVTHRPGLAKRLLTPLHGHGLPAPGAGRDQDLSRPFEPSTTLDQPLQPGVFGVEQQLTPAAQDVLDAFGRSNQRFQGRHVTSSESS